MELLKDLIKIDSSTKASANEAILYCEKWLKDEGLLVKLIEHNGHKSILCEIGAGNKTLIFNGHVDVVNAKTKQFSPYESDGKLFGRGSADMKAGVSAMMCALVDLKNEILPCKVQLQLVSDEEQGGENCSQYLTDQGYIGDFVVCGEPTNLGIGVQAKGILQIDIEVHGKSAHGSRPWQGKNAIIKAYEIFNKITKLPFAKEKAELYEFPSINLSKIEGGNVYNKVPDYCKISLDIRFLPQQNIDEILKQIKSIAGENVTIYSQGDPVKTDINDPHVKKLIESIVLVSKQGNVSTFGQHGSADTRFFSKFNIPAIEFGPCGENWHGDDEYVTLKSVELYKEILVQFAKDFA